MLTPLVRLSHVLAGPRRTPVGDRRLAFLLVVVAGALNAVGFTAVGLYTSHMTGITAQAGQHLVQGVRLLWGAGVLSIVMFIAGAAVSTLMVTWGRRTRRASRYANVLLLKGAMLLLIGLLADSVDGTAGRTALVAPLCFTMGLQNALVTRVRGFPIRTTHVTGMVTDLAVELARGLYRTRDPQDPTAPRMDRYRALILTALVVLFFTGGLVGPGGYALMGFPVLAVLLLLVAAPAVLRDLRRRR